MFPVLCSGLGRSPSLTGLSFLIFKIVSSPQAPGGSKECSYGSWSTHLLWSLHLSLQYMMNPSSAWPKMILTCLPSVVFLYKYSPGWIYPPTHYSPFPEVMVFQSELASGFEHDLAEHCVSSQMVGIRNYFAFKDLGYFFNQWETIMKTLRYMGVSVCYRWSACKLWWEPTPSGWFHPDSEKIMKRLYSVLKDEVDTQFHLLLF